jgi:hypothetical protein
MDVMGVEVFRTLADPKHWIECTYAVKVLIPGSLGMGIEIWMSLEANRTMGIFPDDTGLI